MALEHHLEEQFDGAECGNLENYSLPLILWDSNFIFSFLSLHLGGWRLGPGGEEGEVGLGDVRKVGEQDLLVDGIRHSGRERNQQWVSA